LIKQVGVIILGAKEQKILIKCNKIRKKRLFVALIYEKMNFYCIKKAFRGFLKAF